MSADHAVPTKPCTVCHTLLPASPENFRRLKVHRDGLASACKTCEARRDRERRARERKRRENREALEPRMAPSALTDARVMPERSGMPPAKNPAAVAMGRLGGLKGGPAWANSLLPEQRTARARKAAKARWTRTLRVRCMHCGQRMVLTERTPGRYVGVCWNCAHDMVVVKAVAWPPRIG